MKLLSLDATSTSPRIIFDGKGSLLMEGRSLPEDVNRLYDPIIEFAQSLKANHLKCNINLEYFNTSSSKKLLELFKYLDSNNQLEQVLINWYFEEGDEDSLEIAEIYEESLRRIQFRYVEYAESAEPVYD